MRKATGLKKNIEEIVTYLHGLNLSISLYRNP